ncbi:MAG: DMT family transporter [Rhodospirillales bacterium]|nr:DMT family transporter [Rhodospirillales bacterium]
MRLLNNPYLLLTLTVLFWAGNNVVGRGVHELVPPMALSYWRWAIAMVVLMPFGLRPLWQERHHWLKHWKILLLLSILSVTSYNTFLYMGLQHTTVINASLMGATMPLQVILLSFILLGTAISLRVSFGFFISLLGVLAVIAQGDLAILLNFQINPGDFIILTGVLTWAMYTVLLIKRPPELSLMGFLMGTVIVGWIFITPLYLWELSTGTTGTWQTQSFLSLAYVGIFPSVLSYIFWNKGVQMIGANKAGVFAYLTPVFGATLGVIFLNESFQIYHGVGIALIFFGVWLTTRKKA